MRVTVVNFYGKGGMLYYAVEFAKALNRLCRVRLILPRKSRGFYGDFTEHLDVAEVDVPEDFSRMNLIRLPLYAALFPLLVRQVVRGDPHIVHITNENIWLTGLIPFIGKHRLAWTMHDPVVHLGDSRRKRFATRTLGNSSSLIFVHYQFNRKVAENQGYDPAKLVVIPHGNYSFYERYKREEVQSRRMVLFWGRIRPYKGVETLIDSVSFLPQDVEVVIAGEGAGIYQSAVAQAGRIKLIDRFLTDEEIAVLCQECSVVVTPYIEATQSGIVPVAYAFSKPVVATRVGALPDQVEDGVTGFLVPPNEPRALAEAVTKVLNDPVMAERMGSAGYRKSHTDMSWDNITKTVVSAYDRILRNNPG